MRIKTLLGLFSGAIILFSLGIGHQKRVVGYNDSFKEGSKTAPPFGSGISADDHRADSLRTLISGKKNENMQSRFKILLNTFIRRFFIDHSSIHFKPIAFSHEGFDQFKSWCFSNTCKEIMPCHFCR